MSDCEEAFNMGRKDKDRYLPIKNILYEIIHKIVPDSWEKW